MSSMLFTSESVTEGHPDKMCDIISDSILDAALREDPNSRVAIETMVKNGYPVISPPPNCLKYYPTHSRQV